MGTSKANGLGPAQLQAQRTAVSECSQQLQIGRIAAGALVRLLPRPVAQGESLAAKQAGESPAAWLNSQRLQAHSTRRTERAGRRARAGDSGPAPPWLVSEQLQARS